MVDRLVDSTAEGEIIIDKVLTVLVSISISTCAAWKKLLTTTENHSEIALVMAGRERLEQMPCGSDSEKVELSWSSDHIALVRISCFNWREMCRLSDVVSQLRALDSLRLKV